MSFSPQYWRINSDCIPFFFSFILFEMLVCTTMLLALVVSASILSAFLIGDRLGFCTKFHVFYNHSSQSAILHPHTHFHTPNVCIYISIWCLAQRFPQVLFTVHYNFMHKINEFQFWLMFFTCNCNANAHIFLFVSVCVCVCLTVYVTCIYLSLEFHKFQKISIKIPALCWIALETTIFFTKSPPMAFRGCLVHFCWKLVFAFNGM